MDPYQSTLPPPPVGLFPVKTIDGNDNCVPYSTSTPNYSKPILEPPPPCLIRYAPPPIVNHLNKAPPIPPIHNPTPPFYSYNFPTTRNPDNVNSSKSSLIIPFPPPALPPRVVINIPNWTDKVLPSPYPILRIPLIVSSSSESKGRPVSSNHHLPLLPQLQFNSFQTGGRIANDSTQSYVESNYTNQSPYPVQRQDQIYLCKNIDCLSAFTNSPPEKPFLTSNNSSLPPINSTLSNLPASIPLCDSSSYSSSMYSAQGLQQQPNSLANYPTIQSSLFNLYMLLLPPPPTPPPPLALPPQSTLPALPISYMSNACKGTSPQSPFDYQNVQYQTLQPQYSPTEVFSPMSNQRRIADQTTQLNAHSNSFLFHPPFRPSRMPTHKNKNQLTLPPPRLPPGQSFPLRPTLIIPDMRTVGEPTMLQVNFNPDSLVHSRIAPTTVFTTKSIDERMPPQVNFLQPNLPVSHSSLRLALPLAADRRKDERKYSQVNLFHPSSILPPHFMGPTFLEGGANAQVRFPLYQSCCLPNIQYSQSFPPRQTSLPAISSVDEQETQRSSVDSNGGFQYNPEDFPPLPVIRDTEQDVSPEVESFEEISRIHDPPSQYPPFSCVPAICSGNEQAPETIPYDQNAWYPPISSGPAPPTFFIKTADGKETVEITMYDMYLLLLPPPPPPPYPPPPTPPTLSPALSPSPPSSPRSSSPLPPSCHEPTPSNNYVTDDPSGPPISYQPPTIDHPALHQPPTIDHPALHQPPTIDLQASHQPLPIDNTASHQPLPIDNTASYQPLLIDNTASYQPLPIDNTASHLPPTIDHPASHQPPTIDQPASHQLPIIDHPASHQPPTAYHPASHQSHTIYHAASHQPHTIYHPPSHQPPTIDHPVPSSSASMSHHPSPPHFIMPYSSPVVPASHLIPPSIETSCHPALQPQPDTRPTYDENYFSNQIPSQLPTFPLQSSDLQTCQYCPEQLGQYPEQMVSLSTNGQTLSHAPSYLDNFSPLEFDPTNSSTDNICEYTPAFVHNNFCHPPLALPTPPEPYHSSSIESNYQTQPTPCFYPEYTPFTQPPPELLPVFNNKEKDLFLAPLILNKFPLSSLPPLPEPKLPVKFTNTSDGWTLIWKPFRLPPPVLVGPSSFIPDKNETELLPINRLNINDTGNRTDGLISQTSVFVPKFISSQYSHCNPQLQKTVPIYSPPSFPINYSDYPSQVTMPYYQQ